MEAPLLGSSASLAWSKRWAPLPQVLMVLDTITTGFHIWATMNYQIWDNHELSTSYCYKYPMSMHQCMTISITSPRLPPTNRDAVHKPIC